MDNVYVDLEKSGFAPDQIYEIEEGMKNGLDVSVYAHREYFALQMRQIRLGMMEGLAIEEYTDAGYDWFQMEEIRKGLRKHLDIGLYSSPDIPYDKMRQIRKGLAVGIDLTPFMRLDAGTLREMRKAMVSGINIIPYIQEGYDRDQLEQIRRALKKGVDIRHYLRRQFRGASIHEICIGLEHGLDVSDYAQPFFDWRQMKEIRLGMEHRVDVSQYLNRLYDWKQMREIRLGLEDGLDISCYRSMMYTAGEMEKKRLCLQDEIAKQYLCGEAPAEERKQAGGFVITIKNGGMEAYIEPDEDMRDTADISAKAVVDSLFACGITDGIMQDAIEELVNGTNTSAPVLVAQGVKPRNGADGWYAFYFDTGASETPALLEDGSVDYQNTKWFEVVNKGQKIAYYNTAAPGTDGYTVTGKKLKAQRGRELRVLYGKGFHQLSDKKTYVADVTGKIEQKGSRLTITRLLALDDMTASAGNVVFDGCVCVHGNVGGGSSIKATGDIIVDGYVESAVLESGGSIILRSGANASGKGTIQAKGCVIAKFLEAVSVAAGMDIYAGYCLNCSLSTDGQILILGSRGMLAGGAAYAALGIQVNHVGNNSGIKTYINIGMNENIVKQQRSILGQIVETQKELAILKNAYAAYHRKYKPEICNTLESFRKIEKAIYTKEKQLDKENRLKARLEEKLAKIEGAAALIRGNVYEGVCLAINGEKWIAENTGQIMVRNVAGRIALFANETDR